METALPAPDPRVPLYRVVDQTELAHLLAIGNYGSSPSRSGKYFAMTLLGAHAFCSHPMNAGSTITETSLPLPVVKRASRRFFDVGLHGAGESIWFEEIQLPMVYLNITRPAIV
jgi:hypothetical protein